MHHHYDDDQLGLIKQKIESMKIALFKAESNSVLQLPSNIIQVIKAESNGTVWFITSCNGDYAKSIDTSFYAHLDFYKKGTGCPLKISGKASIVEDEPEFVPEMITTSPTLAGRLVLVKMKIGHAECFENKPALEGSWKDKFKTAFYHLFLSTPYRTYNFS